MYIQTINTKQNGKIYPSVVLCHSYREKGKQKRKILANMTKWPEHIVRGLEKIIKGVTVFSLDDLEHEQGKSYGAVWVLYEMAKQIGLDKILGSSLHGKLAMVQIMARCISRSSRLHIANYWPEHYAIEEILKLNQAFDEDDLYANLDWLADHQQSIEKRLFKMKYPQGQIKQVYLYDVTSSYFEGTKNELSEYGYYRDKKKGKKQIVIGLLCDDEGDPVSIEVFKGNTSDTNTFFSQLQKLKEQFGVERVVMIGDKGMIKSKQIDQITQMEWNYITSITKAQIEKLLSQDIIQMELFEEEPVEIKDGDTRYILRRNAQRAILVQENRASKISAIEKLTMQLNTYLHAHPKAKVSTAINKIQAKIKKLKLSKILQITFDERKILLNTDKEALEQTQMLDGCYVIKTELTKQQATTQLIHDRYKDLSKVEHAFRTLKTGLEEMRPIFLRKESRTRGHVLVCMLAYKLIHKFRTYISDMSQVPTMKEMISSLEAIHYTIFNFEGQIIKVLPRKLNPTQTKILNFLNLELPSKV